MKCVHCEKDLRHSYMWITQYNRSVCVECYELISGNRAEMRCLN